MRKFAVALCVVSLLAGCQTITRKDLQGKSNLALCYEATKTRTPEALQVYIDELSSRAENCKRHEDSVASLRAADAERYARQQNALAGMAAAQQLMNANRPPPMQLAPQISCRSRQSFGTVYTDCN